MLAYPRADSADDASVVVTRITVPEGRSSWSKVVPCPSFASEAAGAHFYLLCSGPPSRQQMEIVELDTASGSELARAPLVGSVEGTAGGELCGLSEKAVGCARFAGGRLEKLWSAPTRAYTIEVAGAHVLVANDKELVARRANDGQVAWKRNGEKQIVGHDEGRIVLLGDGELEVVELRDGKSQASFATAAKGGADVLADAGLLLIAPRNRSDEPIHLLDAQSRVRKIAKNVAFLSQLASNVLLSRDVGMSGDKREAASLAAYSLSRFGPPANQLPPYERLLAVLELHPFAYDAHDALPELRKIPDWTALLQRAIATGPERLKSSAIAVVELSGDARFLPALDAQLERSLATPGGARDWPRVVALFTALAAIDSPDAVTSLLAFWRRVGVELSPPSRRVIVRDLVASALWKYGARKDWVECEDGAFPVTAAARAKAVFGSKSPSIEYAVDKQRGWGAICEARTDDDGNGKLEVVVHHHGDTGGDQLRPYLVLGSGLGTEVDDFVAAAPNGDWIVVTRNMCVELVDTRTGKSVALKRADGRPGDAVAGWQRAASFSADGKSMLYLESNGEQARVIVRELASGTERSIDPGPGKLSRAFFEASGRFVVLEVVVQDSDGDGALRVPRAATSLASRRCRGPVASASFFGQLGDTPVQRVVPRAGGVVTDVLPGTTYRPAAIPPPKYGLAAEREAVGLPGRTLPLGPLSWAPASRR